ncbi:hypothetical protein AAC387_Pa03g3743 [Persea americana]
MASSASSPTARENCRPKEPIPNFKSTEEFYRYLEKSKPTQLMVINFTTEWCEPCKQADEPFKNLPHEYEDVKFAKVDVDVLMNIAEALGATMMPTFLLVKVKKEKEHVKKDDMQGDHKEKKEPPVLNKRYKMVKLDHVVGWSKKKQEELRGLIRKHRHTTT